MRTIVKAVCPGSFDPVTYGHLDVIQRTARIFDEVYATVFINERKQPWFSVEERLDMLREATADLDNVVVDSSRGLLVEYVANRGIRAVVKGLRAVSDFENEFQMAQMNKMLDDDIETVFIMSRSEHAYLSSSIIKEVARFGGSIRQFVPAGVAERMDKRLAELG